MLTKTTFLLDYGMVPSGYVTVGTQLFSEPEHTGADLAEQVPPLDQDATLLAVVPIPGTGTSLAIVGYVIPRSAEPGATGQYDPGERAGTTTPAAPPGSAAQLQPAVKPGGLRLDQAQRRVWADDKEIPLTFREFELLSFLSAHPATVFTRAELVERVWDRAPAQDSRAIAEDSRTVDVHVSRVRRKLGPRHGRSLVTEYRVGYQFRPAP